MHNLLTATKKRSPIAWVPSVYFGMGLPYVALSLVSVIMFTDLGIGKEEVTFLVTQAPLQPVHGAVWDEEAICIPDRVHLCTHVRMHLLHPPIA